MQTDASMAHEPAGRVLIIVENLPVPFDRRVWQEATALREAGYTVSVICPKGRGYDESYEELGGIHVYRHDLPLEASGALGYLVEYSAALFWQFVLSLKISRRHGFDLIHACNPPDLIFIVALFHKALFGKKFLFDQHDINPELYEVKFGRKGFFHRLLTMFERWTFRCADGSLATNATLKDRARRVPWHAARQGLGGQELPGPQAFSKESNPMWRQERAAGTLSAMSGSWRSKMALISWSKR